MLPHLCSHPGSLPSYSGSTFQGAVCSTALQARCVNPRAGLCTHTSSPASPTSLIPFPGSAKSSEQRVAGEMGAHVGGKGQLNPMIEALSSSSHPHPSRPHSTGCSPPNSPRLGSGVTLCLVLPHPIPASHRRGKHVGYTARRGQKPMLTAGS